MELKILCELDMFLDTRISTVSMLSEQAAIEFLGDEYRNRVSDELGLLTDKITTEAYKDAYRKRNKHTLFKARATPMVYVFGKSMNEHIEIMAETKKFTRICVDVNIYPYELTEEEKVAIVECFMAYGGVEVTYRCVSIAPFELTLGRIKEEGYATIFMYNYIDWAETHIEKLQEGDPMLPSVVLIIPELVKSREEYKKTPFVKMPDGTEVNPFQAMRIILAPIIGIQTVPAELISILELPRDLFTQGESGDRA